MKIKIKNRKIISFILTLVMLITGIPSAGGFTAANPDEVSISIYSDNQPVSSIVLERSEKRELKAAGLSEDAQYQWQIMIPEEETWVNIDDKQTDTCEVSCALIDSILGDHFKTAVRCTAQLGEDSYISEPVYIAMNAAEYKNDETIITPKYKISTLSESMPSKAARSNEYAKIIIHYMLDEVQIFDDYVATLHYGTSFSAHVPSPTYVGYSPYIMIDGEEKDASDVTISYTNLEDSQELTVYYKPAMSTYSVRYYLQNVSNDLYTEDTNLSYIGEALTGAYPKGDIEKNIDGFTSLFHEPDAVAADGSTEFHCYYDRNYYLYHFNCNGGYGTEPIYARYGTHLIVNNPIREGYVFAGWDKQEENGSYDGTADALPTTIGIENLTYKAIWEAADTTYTVVYWNENPDDENYSYWDSTKLSAKSGNVIKIDDILSGDAAIDTRPSKDVVPDDEFRHYIFNQERTQTHLGDNGTMIAGDGSTTINIYYDRRDYTLRFYYARKDNSNENYYAVCGSTYGFGNIDTTDFGKLIQNVAANGWGHIEKPTLSEKGQRYIDEGKYRAGEEINGGYTYYYLDFTSKYGTTIKDMWPCGIFNQTKVYDGVNGDYSVFSAWNGEHHVAYSRNSNQTIKGNYLKLDDEILYEPQYQDQYKQVDSAGNYVNDGTGTNLVSYLAFWENGAGIGWSQARKWTYKIYLEALPKDLDNPDIDKVEYGGKQYYLYDTTVCCDNNADIGSQTATTVPGFKNIGEKLLSDTLTEAEKVYYESAHIAEFYYDRIEYPFVIMNNGHNITGSNYPIKYGSFLIPAISYILSGSFDNSVPPYPDNLEKGIYEFKGWYTSPLFFEETKVTEDTQMLSKSMIVYARWELISHEVTFSNTFDDMMQGVYIDNKIINVEHDKFIPTADIAQADSASLGGSQYEFKGWFYFDEAGGKHAFDPDNMTVMEEMHLYAEWRSSDIVQYNVHYVDEEGNKVAEDFSGYTYVGMTKTFTAKSGDELNAAYQQHYYPFTNSSSILMKKDGKNEVTFVYKHLDSVNYTVKYVNKLTGEEFTDPAAKTVSTSDAVITEKYEYISKYISDAFYKRLVLSADEKQNVITFYYTKDELNARFVVKYMTEDLEGGSYSEYAAVEGIGRIGSNISADVLTVTGFDFDEGKTKTENPLAEVGNGKVSTELNENADLIIYIYYTRKESSYTVKFVEYGNVNNILKDSETLIGKYGEKREYNAPATIKDGTGSNEMTYNLVGSGKYSITFSDNSQTLLVYYQAKKVTINYIAVSQYPGTEFGSVSLAWETVANAGNIAGAEPQANAGYRFVGWFSDAACTQKVTSDVDEVSGRLKLSSMPSSDVYYYALFEPEKAELKVTKSINEESIEDQTFMYSIVGEAGTDSASVNMKFAVTIEAGNLSSSINLTNLPVGRYCITETPEWSWKYTAESNVKNIVLTVGLSGEVQFVNEKRNKGWLGGETYIDNKFQ